MSAEKIGFCGLGYALYKNGHNDNATSGSIKTSQEEDLNLIKEVLYRRNEYSGCVAYNVEKDGLGGVTITDNKPHMARTVLTGHHGLYKLATPDGLKQVVCSMSKEEISNLSESVKDNEDKEQINKFKLNYLGK